MEKKIKRLLSLVLALILVVGLAPVGHIHAVEGEEEELLAAKLTNYRWETTASGTSLKNITTEGYTRNPITNLKGTVNGTTLTDVYGNLTDAVILLPTDEWAIEWESAGTWEGMLISNTASYKTNGNMYVYHASATNSFTIGEKNSGTYHNNGFTISLVKAAFEAAGKTYTNEDTHVFRIENRVSGNTNVPYLIIDGVEIGAMSNCYHGSYATVNNCGYGLAGEIITFNYFGANGKPLDATNFTYLEITGAHTHTGEWTKGETEMTRTCTTCGAAETASYTAYRWEVSDEDVFQSVATDGYYVENALTGTAGTIVDGELDDVRRTITNGITLKHNQPWVIEWNAKGNWSGILLSSHNDAVAGMDIVFKKANTSDNRLGLVIGGRASNYTNYGVKMSQVKTYFADYAVWRLENKVNDDGTNMVYLYINDTLIGDMTYYFVDANATGGTQGDYVNGRDLYYKYIGLGTSHDVCDMILDYLEIWPNGKPAEQEEEHVCDFNIEQEVVAGEDCENVGYTVWACECGDTETRANEVYGDHDWDEGTHEAGNCTDWGTTHYECTVCGETKDVDDTVAGDHSYKVVSSTTGADCQTAGVDTYECEFCHDSYTEANEKFGDHNHELFDSTTGADCKTAGVDTYKCACGDTYTEANEKFGDHSYGEWEYDGSEVTRTCAVCENDTQTAKYAVFADENITGYSDFEEALSAAPANSFILMFADAEVDALELTEGRSLDLCGYVLKAGSVVVDNGSCINDGAFYAGTGKLVVPQDKIALDKNNGHLPVWTGDGYVFATTDEFHEMTETPSSNKSVYYFQPEISENVHEYLVSGGAVLKVKLNWTKDGQAYTATVSYTDELLQEFLDGYDAETGKYAYAFKLSVTGIDAIDEDSLTFTVYLESLGVTLNLN